MTTRATSIPEPPPPAPRAKLPLWRGPEVDGITNSLLGRFLVCRERFRCMVCEGLGPRGDFMPAIEFGNMWHLCEEIHAKGGKWADALRGYCDVLGNRHVMARAEVEEWYDKCRVMFPIYLDYWRNDAAKGVKVLLQEEVFREEYTLPNGRTVKLRGKWDRVDFATVQGQKGLRVRDNKTKSKIDEDAICRQLTFDLQMMLYTVALTSRADGLDKMPVVGFQYNVVKRPGQYQGKKERRDEFCIRLAKLVAESPQEFFARWDVPVRASDIREFQVRFLNPVLTQLCEWWDWMQRCYKSKSVGSDVSFFDNPIHWQHPFGIWNSLDEGGGTHLDRYIATGDDAGLTRVVDLYPELKT